MDLGLRGKVAVVTGGASNIGRAISIVLAAEGARVAILDSDEQMAQRTANNIRTSGGAATVYEVDLTDGGATDAATGAVGTDLGPIDILVNNVGWSGEAAFFLDMEPERWDRTYRLNLYTTLNATRAVLPAMVERRNGAIVSMSSDAGFGEMRMGDYGPMKAGVMAFTRTIAKEYGRFGVRANTVCPGLVIPDPDAIGAGSMWQVGIGFDDKQADNLKKATPLRSLPTATDVANTVAWLVSEPARMLSGQAVTVSGGFSMPR